MAFITKCILIATVFYTFSITFNKNDAEIEHAKNMLTLTNRRDEEADNSPHTSSLLSEKDLDGKITTTYINRNIETKSLATTIKAYEHSQLASNTYSQLALRNGIILKRHGKVFQTYKDYMKKHSSVSGSINTEAIIYSQIPSLGLGNQMFAYASGYAIARNNKRKFRYFNYYTDLERIFHVVQRKADKVTLDNNLSIIDSKCCRYDPIFLNLPRVNLTLPGFFQSWKYFEKFKTEIRLQFRFRNQPDQRNSHDVIREIKQRHKNVTLIGLHIRRGDMIRDVTASKHGHKVADKSYLRRAISFYEEKFMNCFYVVCSDDNKWSKENIGIHSNKLYFSKQQSKEHDLQLLTLCDHLIITVGTFGWWAGYLNNGTVVYYKEWPIKGSMFSKSVVAKDYFPDDWIGL